MISQTTFDGTKYTSAVIDSATEHMFGTAYTAEPGNAITPVSGTVYYIKEVPAADFLLPRLRYTYYKMSGAVGTAWLFTNLDVNTVGDDAPYKEIGFLFNDNIENRVAGGELTNAFTVIPCNDTDNPITYVSGKDAGEGEKRVFPHGPMFTWLKVYNDDVRYSDGGPNPDLIGPGKVVKFYWVTPDNMVVTGTSAREYKAFVNIGSNTVSTNGLISTITYIGS